MNFFTADLHFLHKNIIKFERGYFPDIDYMNRSMINIINEQVRKGDNLFILGDVALGSVHKATELLEQVEANILIVPGNHDTPKALKTYAKVAEILPPIYELGDIVMCHFPLTVWNKSHHGSIHLHGHTHGSFQGKGKILDVGWDNVYKTYGVCQVLSEEDIRDIMVSKEIYMPSHHGNN